MNDGILPKYNSQQDVNDILTSIRTCNLEQVKLYPSKSNVKNNELCNMLIFGDNEVVMKKLLEDKIKGIRLVYIDPPFSTNNIFKSGKKRTSTVSHSKSDEIAYNDQLTGLEYLEFLRRRIVVMRELLEKDGSFYLHIDTKIGHYVKILIDGVFGKEFFVNDITRIKSNPKNFPRPAFGNIKDVIFFYSKTKKYVWNESLEDYTDEDIIKLFPKIDKEGRRYTTNPLHAPNESNGQTGKSWKGLKPPKGRHWRYKLETLDELDKNGLIERSSTGNPRKIIYADDFIAKKKKRQDIWSFKDKPNPVYPTQKNLDMLKMIVQTSSNENDIVLDSFVGGGSTIVAAEEEKRRWIGIDNSPKAIEVTLKRLSAIKNHQPFALYATEEMLPKLPKALQKLAKQKST